MELRLRSMHFMELFFFFLQNNNHQTVNKMKWIENRKNRVETLRVIVNVWFCECV